MLRPDSCVQHASHHLFLQYQLVVMVRVADEAALINPAWSMSGGPSGVF